MSGAKNMKVQNIHLKFKKCVELQTVMRYVITIHICNDPLFAGVVFTYVFLHDRQHQMVISYLKQKLIKITKIFRMT